MWDNLRIKTIRKSVREKQRVRYACFSGWIIVQLEHPMQLLYDYR